MIDSIGFLFSSFHSTLLCLCSWLYCITIGFVWNLTTSPTRLPYSFFCFADIWVVTNSHAIHDLNKRFVFLHDLQ